MAASSVLTLNRRVLHLLDYTDYLDHLDCLDYLECLGRRQLLDLDAPRHHAGEDMGVDIDGPADAADERLLALNAPQNS